MNHFVNVNKKAACVLLALALCAGCASDKLRANGYKAFGSYVLAEETAAAVVTNPATPAKVVTKIQSIVSISAPAAEALYHDLTVYAALQDEIAGIKAAGGTASQQLMAKMGAASTALVATYSLTLPKIMELVAAIAELKGK